MSSLVCIIAGLKEKTRQGLLASCTARGYIKGEDGIAVRALSASTARGRAFSIDTVREMLCNAAYAGFVSGRRDTSKAIKGLHEPIVEEALFDRVQLMRRNRARTLHPGRPSTRYLLRGLATCERCQSKMHGTSIGRKLVARYYCANRRATHDCDQPLVHADRVEAQLVEFMADFKPTKATCKEILRRLAGGGEDTTEVRERHAALEERLARARDLYELGDLTRPEYMARRDAINSELAALAPEPIPDLSQARKVLEDFTIFWRRETDPVAKRQLLSLIFERVWLDEQRVVAVRPKTPFVPFFEQPARHRQPDEPCEPAGSIPGTGVCKERERRKAGPVFAHRGIEIRV